MKRNSAGIHRRNFLRNVALDRAGVTLYGWDGRASAQPAPDHATTTEPAAARRALPLNPQWRFRETFRITANSSDAVLVTAQVVGAKGVWCPLADHNIRFTVTGAGTYRGSANFYVTPDQPLTYHAPGDPELQAEGGRMRIAIRAGFAPGAVQVKAEADGIKSALASFAVGPVEA